MDTQESRYNLDLMGKVLEVITLYPELHDQTSYEDIDGPSPDSTEVGNTPCGTTRCVAGWGIILSYPETKSLDGAMRAHVKKLAGEMGEGEEPDPDLQYNYLEVGASLLGLSRAEAYTLFYDLRNNVAKDALEFIIDHQEFPWHMYDDDDSEYFSNEDDSDFPYFIDSEDSGMY
jgi:hypothetical protein